ncbi:MAG: hypothetical protein JAY74_20690 [Candidatus Thiodiazotropha taylori]|nr:hypothetical protein [Candidatus Thiodiazotropha taylori]
MLIKHFTYILLFLSASLFTVTSQAADVTAQQIGNYKTYSIKIVGEIQHGDYDQLIKLIKSKSRFPFYITIKSKGGSVSEAIKISKFVNEALIPVNALDYCYSSCFYIWIASIERNVFFYGMNTASDSEIMESRVIGLHRPYYDKAYFSTLSMKEAQAKQGEIETEVRNYLKSLNVHEKWIDEMMMHSSSDIRLVSRKELEQEFGFTSHAFEEWLIAKCPIDEHDLIFGKAELIMRATSSDDSKVKINIEQRNKALNEYKKYSKCKDTAIRESQAAILNSILQ